MIFRWKTIRHYDVEFLRGFSHFFYLWATSHHGTYVSGLIFASLSLSHPAICCLTLNLAEWEILLFNQFKAIRKSLPTEILNRTEFHIVLNQVRFFATKLFYFENLFRSVLNFN